METRYEYVLVGGGVTSVWAAQNIRDLDKTGRIVILTDDSHPPYDRPPLSKNMLTDDKMASDDPYIKYDDFYPKNEIELRKSTRVTGVDRAAKTVTLEGGETLAYEKLLLCTGSTSKTLDLPGSDRPGVHLLRSLNESLALREALQKCSRLVIAGSGYIGMEVAAGARTRGIEVTIVEPQGHPWAKFASEAFGRFLQQYYESKGVHFVFQDTVTQFDGDGENGAVTTVRTKNGLSLPADCVLVAVGAQLNTELPLQAGLAGDPQRGIQVDEYLRTDDESVWVAGDIACFRDIALGKTWHAEHHLNAKWQGQAVGKNMAGANEPYDRVPYFFSDEFDLHMVLRGDPQGGKTSFFAGDVEGAEFVELYLDEGGVLKMGLAISRDEPKLDALSDTLESLIRAKVNLRGREAEIQAPGFDLNTLL